MSKTKAATAKKDELVATKMITPTLRWSYLHAFTPSAMEGSNVAKYGVSLIIPKTEKALVAEIKKKIELAKEVGKDKKWGGKIPANLKLPLRDGDTDRPEDDTYANAYFITASSPTKPGVVDKNKEPITDTTEVYSGCYGKASISFYPFNAAGNKGIAVGLNNLMKIKDGEPLGGRVSAEVDFADTEVEENDDDDSI